MENLTLPVTLEKNMGNTSLVNKNWSVGYQPNSLGHSSTQETVITPENNEYARNST